MLLDKRSICYLTWNPAALALMNLSRVRKSLSLGNASVEHVLETGNTRFLSSLAVAT